MKRNHNLAGICAAIGVVVLILDTKTAIRGAKESIELCLQTIIPSLFPFIVLSSVIIKTYYQPKSGILSKLLTPCGIPTGCESIFLLGLLGGYPVGAKCIYEAYTEGKIDKSTARRLLGFCSNAGPGFIFGVIGQFFTNRIFIWLLWLIHILSAWITGYLLPNKKANRTVYTENQEIPLSNTLEDGIKVMARIIAWILLLRIILTFFNKWFLWAFTYPLQVIIAGIIELSNGCLMLNLIDSETIRFLVAAFLVNLGGICILLQTKSVTADLGLGYYLRGKTLQTLVSLSLAIPVATILSIDHLEYTQLSYSIISTVILIVIINLCVKIKIPVDFFDLMRYNKKKTVNGV